MLTDAEKKNVPKVTAACNNTNEGTRGTPSVVCVRRPICVGCAGDRIINTSIRHNLSTFLQEELATASVNTLVSIYKRYHRMRCACRVHLLLPFLFGPPPPPSRARGLVSVCDRRCSVRDLVSILFSSTQSQASNKRLGFLINRITVTGQGHPTTRP